MINLKKFLIILFVIFMSSLLYSKEVWLLLDSSASLSRRDAILRNQGAIIVATLTIEENKNNKIGIIDFSHKIRLLYPTSDLIKIKNFIRSIGRSGKLTDIEGALRKIEDRKDSEIYLFTDGRIDINKNGLDYMDILSRKRVIEEIVPKLKENNIKVHCIGLKSRNFDEELLEIISKETSNETPVVANKGIELKKLFYDKFFYKLKYRLYSIDRGDGKVIYEVNKNLDKKYITYCKVSPLITPKEITMKRVEKRVYIMGLKKEKASIIVPKECKVNPLTSKIDFQIISPNIARSQFFENEEINFQIEIFPEKKFPEIINFFKKGKVVVYVDIFDPYNKRQFFKTIKLKKISEKMDKFVYKAEKFYLSFKNCNHTPEYIRFRFKINFIFNPNDSDPDIILVPHNYASIEKKVIRFLIKKPDINISSIWTHSKRNLFFIGDKLLLKFDENQIRKNLANIKNIEYYFNNKKLNLQRENNLVTLNYNFTPFDKGIIKFYTIVNGKYYEKNLDQNQNVKLKIPIEEFKVINQPFVIKCNLKKKDGLFFAGYYFKDVNQINIPFKIKSNLSYSIPLFFDVKDKSGFIKLVTNDINIDKNKSSFIVSLKVDSNKIKKVNNFDIFISSASNITKDYIKFSIFFIKYPFLYIILSALIFIIFILIMFYMICFIRFKNIKNSISDIKFIEKELKINFKLLTPTTIFSSDDILLKINPFNGNLKIYGKKIVRIKKDGKISKIKKYKTIDIKKEIEITFPGKNKKLFISLRNPVKCTIIKKE